jgi:hypothetical protein
MPLLLLGAGALLGGGTVWAVSETSKKLVTAAVVGGALYYLYKRG